MQKTTKQKVDEEFAALSQAANEATAERQDWDAIKALFEAIGRLRAVVDRLPVEGA